LLRTAWSIPWCCSCDSVVLLVLVDSVVLLVLVDDGVVDSMSIRWCCSCL
jgi:hypothetical protein